jgi:hypothetical protein
LSPPLFCLFHIFLLFFPLFILLLLLFHSLPLPATYLLQLFLVVTCFFLWEIGKFIVVCANLFSVYLFSLMS